MEEKLWAFVMQNAEHIKIINHELGEIYTELGKLSSSVDMMKVILSWGFGLLSGLILLTWGTVLKQVNWIKKNNKR